MPRPRLALAGITLGLLAMAGEAPTIGASRTMSIGEARAIVTKRASVAMGVGRGALKVSAFEPIAGPHGDRRWYLAKVQRVNGSIADTFLAYVDPRSGGVVSVDRWRRDHPLGKASKLDTDVEASLERGQPQTVAVWVRSEPQRKVVRRVHRLHPGLVDRAGSPASGGRDATLAARDLLRTAHARSAQSALSAVVARAESLGLHVEYASGIVPVMWVTGSPARIRRLAARSDVLRVQSSGMTSLSLGAAGESDQISRGAGYSHRHGYKGSGVRIAVVEYGNVSWGVPDLDSVRANRRQAYSTVPGVLVREPHPTAVMSVIASDSARRPGIAPAATYISSGTGGEQGGPPSQAEDFRALEALENAILPSKGNADVVNLSFGQESVAGAAAMRAYVDWVVRVYDVHVAAAAGNRVSQARCQDAAHSVVAPGTGWNVVTVGGVDDRGTARWRDDRLYKDTCYGDPPGGTFKPEISAPAVRIGVNGADHTGTSFATPQAAGAMALLIDQVEALRTRPHQVKAILLAGSFVRRTVARKVHRKEGVGTLAMKWAHWAAGNKRKGGSRVAMSGEVDLQHGPEVDGCWQEPPHYDLTVDTQPGRRVRFVASWQSHGFYDQQSRFGPNDDFVDGRKSDIDVVVRTASGERKTGATRANRTVEVVQWRTVMKEMPYSVRLTPVDWDCDLASERIGWAWVAPR